MSIDKTKSLILVAEDDSVTSAVMAKRLENAGYAVITANTGLQAMEQCCKEQPELILMDATMPELDGFDACRGLKDNPDTQINTIPIIMVTALEELSAIDKAFEVGAEDYVHKPVNWHLLEHRLKVLLQKIDAEKTLKENEAQLKKLSTAVKQSPNLVVMTNLEGIIDYINPQVEKITGYKKEEVIGLNISFLRSGFDDLLDNLKLWEKLKQGQAWNGSLQNKKKNGDCYWVRESITPIMDDEGHVSHYVSIQEDITEEKKLATEIAYRASHDSLTGLINRHEFEVYLGSLLRNTEEFETHALCVIDLDRFKIVNDTAGHLAGDELLRQLSVQMKKIGRKHDRLARLGGDEFALVLSHCEQTKAFQVAENLRQCITDFRLTWDGKILKVGSSIGVVAIKKGDQAAEVLKLADTACYAAKNTGRDRVYQFSEDDKYLSEKSGELQWVAKIEQALTENQFALYAQKIVPLADSKAVPKYEVLLRLVDEDKKIVPPGAFLPAAERFNLATKIDCWVIEQTLLWFVERPDILDEMESFSINLSGQSLADANIQMFIIDLIKTLNFPTHKLVFEITETSAINNLSQAQMLITGLQKIGVRFSLDDFGSGLSSFAYLKNLPVEFLKIDGMFVKDIEKDPIDRAMVKSINEIGQVMGKKTIAEFVENQPIVDILREIGVDFAQGYHYSKPSPFTQAFSC